MYLLEVKNLRKVYTTAWRAKVEALRSVSFAVEKGESRSSGEWGREEAALLNILAFGSPTSGEVILNGKRLSGLEEEELAAFRRTNLGFVFQDFNLLETFS